LQPELELLRPGRTDLVERRVRDVVADDVAQRDLGPAVDLDVLDQAFVLLGQVLDERVRRFVHVVVRVEHGIAQIDRHNAFFLLRRLWWSPIGSRIWRESQPCYGTYYRNRPKARPRLVIYELTDGSGTGFRRCRSILSSSLRAATAGRTRMSQNSMTPWD